ncbi:helix-turn-helix domain-containing protein [Edaphosphingomonas haloaromaticamans]|uniref:HTH cro/C1-type domain-containing protein n=1 Tax=Edaphosphingomonas haloaromaticamans TaxID=653954 RepID=A0A1S1HIT3_9SPHN|nr:helix-turn-helix domain-containing protein [Sphingomonas haloaromaticamans]OHT22184.1 hypothetical protein BHE75_04208 [Sphingomonas haloaromaticamans]
MSNTETFYRCGEDLKSIPYEYKECGLSGIFLQNGFSRKERDGEEFISIIDMEGLHRSIGEHLVSNRKELAPAEIKFLRKTMDLTQAELGRMMGQSSQQVARWEKGASAIPGPADRLLRILFIVRNMDDEELEEFINHLESIEELDERADQTVTLHRQHDAWTDRLAA